MLKNSSVTKSVPICFAKIFMMTSFDSGLFNIIGYSKDESVLCAVAATPCTAPLLRRRWLV